MSVRMYVLPVEIDIIVAESFNTTAGFRRGYGPGGEVANLLQVDEGALGVFNEFYGFVNQLLQFRKLNVLLISGNGLTRSWTHS